MDLVKEKVDNKKYGSAECSYSTKFTWKIENYSTIGVEQPCGYQIHSDVFRGADHEWGILVLPEGDDEGGDYLSVFLEVPNFETLPSDWSRHVKCRLSVISEIDELTVNLEEDFTFNDYDSIWGHASLVSLKKLWDIDQRYIVNDTLTVSAEVWFDGENKKEPKVKRPSSVAEFDALFRYNQKPPKKLKANRSYSNEDISVARELVRSCLNMDAASFIRSRRVPTFDYALHVLLNTEAFPQTKAAETVNFLTNFIQRCEKYEAATRDLSDAQENKDLIGELKTTLKQLSSKFVPVRNEAEAIDKELAWYERWSAEKKAKRARLGKTLNYLADQRIASKKELLRAEHDSKKSKVKNELANKTVTEFLSLWESLKALHSDVNRTSNQSLTEPPGPGTSGTAANYSLP